MMNETKHIRPDLRRLVVAAFEGLVDGAEADSAARDWRSLRNPVAWGTMNTWLDRWEALSVVIET
jgi:hypothetical protein